MKAIDIEQTLIEARINRWDVVIGKAKAYAEDNYDNGMDFYVECYDQKQWVEVVSNEDGTLMTWKEVKKEMNIYRQIKAEQAADICGYGDDGNEKPNSTWWE